MPTGDETDYEAETEYVTEPCGWRPGAWNVVKTRKYGIRGSHGTIVAVYSHKGIADEVADFLTDKVDEEEGT